MWPLSGSVLLHAKFPAAGGGIEGPRTVSLTVEAIPVLSPIPVRPISLGITLRAEKVLGGLEVHLTPGGGRIEVTLTSRPVGLLAVSATVVEEH